MRKYLRVEPPDEPRYRRAEAPTKLTPFHEAIVQALKADARRPKRERRTARALHEQLKSLSVNRSHQATGFALTAPQGQRH